MKKEDTKVTAVKAKETKTKKGWNTMSHLHLKRFADDDPTLTAGAKRDRVKHPHLAVAELDPSGRAACKGCGETIPKSSLRFGLWLECHKGYRNLCTLHTECFWKHSETQKLEKADEITKFFEENPYPKNERKIAQMTENMRANGKFLKILQASDLSKDDFWGSL